jgi:hypothetical protein
MSNQIITAMKYLLILSVLLIINVLSVSETSFAQGAPPPPALPGDVPQAPIDGGLGILAVGGGVYALKKLREQRKLK